MPTGVYKRTPEMKRQIQRAMTIGRSEAVRVKAIESLKRNGNNPEFKQRMSNILKEAWKNPDFRKKKVKAAIKNVWKNGSNFKGGWGHEPLEFVVEMLGIFKIVGFEPEVVIRTEGHKTNHKPPCNYKVDLGLQERKIAIEFDGPCHRSEQRRERDRKKNEVLESLGWRILRINHK